MVTLWPTTVRASSPFDDDVSSGAYAVPRRRQRAARAAREPERGRRRGRAGSAPTRSPAAGSSTCSAPATRGSRSRRCSRATARIPGFHPIVELSMTFHTQVVGANGQRQAMFIERVEGLAEAILANFELGPPDAMIVFSAGGRTAVPIEIAPGREGTRTAGDRGHVGRAVPRRGSRAPAGRACSTTRTSSSTSARRRATRSSSSTGSRRRSARARRSRPSRS